MVERLNSFCEKEAVAMAYQAVFKRYELKYLLDKEQKACIVEAIQKYMELDQYGKTTIRNIYFDTEDYRLIRRSIEKPLYKEKLRVRSYSNKKENDIVFVELKKKYKKVVYKRRIGMSEENAMKWLKEEMELENSSQIEKEITYFLSYYKGLRPALFLSYDREAYFSKEQSDFRVTFDENVLCREQDFSLNSAAKGIPILGKNQVLMEIKCSGGIPLWMTEILSSEKLYKTSFSKYGTAYRTIIYPRLKEMETKR